MKVVPFTHRNRTFNFGATCERCGGTSGDGSVFDVDYIAQNRFVCTSCSDEILAEKRADVLADQVEVQ
jgi:hypothetical protein